MNPLMNSNSKTLNRDNHIAITLKIIAHYVVKI